MEQSISFHATLPVVPPICYISASQLSEWNENEDQLTLVETEGDDWGKFNSQTRNLLSVLESVKPGPRIGSVNESRNCKKNLLAQLHTHLIRKGGMTWTVKAQYSKEHSAQQKRREKITRIELLSSIKE